MRPVEPSKHRKGIDIRGCPEKSIWGPNPCVVFSAIVGAAAPARRTRISSIIGVDDGYLYWDYYVVIEREKKEPAGRDKK